MKKIYVTSLLALTFCFSGLAQEAFRKMDMTMYAIDKLYVDKVDHDKLVEDAIISLLAELDPHSNYLTKEEVKEMNEPLQGNFDGIGIQFNMLTDTLYVVQVIAGGPSQKVGLLSGDRILEVNDTLIAGVKMKNQDIMKRLRGPKGTEVRVRVLRNGVSELIPFRIVRDKIPIYSVEASYMVDATIGYINVSRFAGTTHDEFVKALKELQAQGMKSLIVDLQGNGGGYLNASISICNEFLKGNKLIVYTEGYRQKREDARSHKKGLFEEGKLVVLIDETSASASEIVSGALQDWDRGVLIGRRSFGKGLVQRPIPLPDGSMLRLTTARYYTPTGRSIQKPYSKGGADTYSKDISERYLRGEMMNADSIHFPDSLKFRTLQNQRLVYGGGGIMPDLFVPVDTTKFTAWHRNVVAKGIINKLNLSYIDRHRDELKLAYPSFIQYKEEYQVPESLLEECKELAAADSIVFNETEYLLSKSLLSLQFKALIARDVYERNECYTQIINEVNDSFSRAVALLRNPKEYELILKGKN